MPGAAGRTRHEILPLVEPRALVAVVASPYLWLSAWRLVAGSTRSGWWKRWPFLPLPTRAYLRMRQEAMFGPGGGRLDAEQLVSYLQWCARMRSLAR